MRVRCWPPGRNKKLIGISEFEEAIDRVIAGPERKSRVISDREKAMTAYHEAGHALVGYKLPMADKVHKISIVARGAMGGYTRFLPEGDRSLWTKGQFEDMMATALGGRAAEEIVFGEITTGASDDLQRTTNTAQRMVKQYGMSDNLGPRTFGRRQELVFLGREINEEKDYSDKLAEEIDQEVKDLITTAKQKAETILEENRERLTSIAEFLIEHESVEGENLQALFEGREPVIEDEVEEAPQEVEAPAQPAPTIDPQPRPHLASQQDDLPIPESS